MSGRNGNSVRYDLLAMWLYANNPRIPVVANGKTVAMLRFQPAQNLTERGRRAGEVVTAGGVLGCAIELVVTDPAGFRELARRVNGKIVIRIRCLSPLQLQRLAMRLLEFANALMMANVTNADVNAIRDAYQKLERRATGRRGGEGVDLFGAEESEGGGAGEGEVVF